MSKAKMNKDKILCIIAMVIAVGGYGVERILECVITPDKTTATIMAMVFTVLFAIAYFLVSSSKDTFYGLLASLVGFKMLPASINNLSSYSNDAAILYYIVQKVSIILFVLLIVKIYRSQPQDNKIKLIPLLAAMVCVPFFTEIANTVGKYCSASFGGSLIYLYAAQFAGYIVAMLVILISANNTDYNTLRFITYFEYIALGTNLARKICAVIVLTAKSKHVSLSFYCWIVIFALGIALFTIAKNTAKKKQLQN